MLSEQCRDGEGGREDCPVVPSEDRVWPHLIDCYGPQHWDLALARVLPLCVAGAPETEILWYVIQFEKRPRAVAVDVTHCLRRKLVLLQKFM